MVTFIMTTTVPPVRIFVTNAVKVVTLWYSLSLVCADVDGTLSCVPQYLTCCSGWGARLASLGKAVQSRLPGFMAAPSFTTAGTPVSTAPANGSTQSARDTPGAGSTQPQDAMLSAPEVAVEDVMLFSLQEAQELPPVTLMSSTADIIVPW